MPDASGLPFILTNPCKRVGGNKKHFFRVIALDFPWEIEDALHFQSFKDLERPRCEVSHGEFSIRKRGALPGFRFIATWIGS
jgi:hypothetical protein